VFMVSDDRCDLLCLDLDVAERLRKANRSQASLQLVGERLKALADPTRLAIATALIEADELCGCDLAWIVERSQGLVSHHLRTLHASGLVHSRRDGKMVLYALTPLGRGLVESALAAEVVHG
jgi:ArsR family transcriptional regulator, lead/cadmium/zinc/bismuth-responsive transcriptional repressor